jgi:hypothetical protein
MGSGNYESQILEAIQILVDDAVSKANYDKTIQGTISRCVDATIGKYIVKYQDSSFYAYSHNTETTYPAGASVYVLVPGNDMSKDKSIIGTVDHLGPDYVSIIEGENGYEVTGVNTINADGTFGLCSYKKEDLKILYDRDSQVDLIGLDTFGFEQYVKKSNSIICGATFKTALDSTQKYRGDYGIVFHLDFTDKSTGEVITKSYIVNVDNMTGNPYNYTVASRQYGIFDVDGANFISVKQIYLFAYNFPNEIEGKDNDIFISKVELSAANALEKEAAATCALTFVTPQGTYFDEKDIDEDKRVLQAQIRIKGKAIDNGSQNVDYYWFRENSDITTKSEKYNQYGGTGWECLNDSTIIQDKTEDNDAIVQWTRGNYQYITKKKDNVARETVYKCVAVYFDGTILSKTIVIYNYDSNYEITIQSDGGVAFHHDIGKPNLTCYINGQEELSDAYSYTWSVIDNNNQFSILSETTEANNKYSNAIEKRDEILAKVSAEQLLTAQDNENLALYNQVIAQHEYIMRVQDNKIHNLKVSSITNFSTYRCSVRKSGVFIGSASIIITNTETTNPNYTLIIDNGNQVFKYNEKGISPANGSNQNPQKIMPLSFTLYDETGQKINHSIIKNIEWKVPSEDTLLGVSLTHGNGVKNEDGTTSYFKDPELNISIAPNYKAQYDKNEIQLVLNYNNKVITAKTNFTFVKEGESGTNGTDFVCKIVPYTSADSIAPKYPTVIYNEYTKQYSLNYTPFAVNKWFKVQLWHDGERIFEGTQSGVSLEEKNIEVQWSILQNTYAKNEKTNALITDNSNFSIDKDTAAISFDTTEYANPANIVKAVVKYNNVDYYATLPISIVRVKNSDYDLQLLEDSGFRHVMYTPDGQSPAFDNQPFELIVSQIVEGVKNDISHFETSEFAVDYDWKVKGSVYYSDWKTEENLVKNTLYESKVKKNQKYFKPVDTYNGLCTTNALVCNITRKGDRLASIHIPIHFYINRYGNAAMNGWDGNSISLDENGTTILAPQIGAGSKNDDNTFTGVFMGSIKEPGAEKEEHGLFGYHNGQRTITLNSQDGSARFGKAGLGQIVIDPTTDEAVIRSGVYDEDSGVGMEINLTEPSIKFASGKFEVDKNGNVTAEAFATKGDVKDLEESISYFTIDTDTDSILIPATSDNIPLESKSYTIAFKGKFKGKEITSFTEELASASIPGITTSLNNNSITFTVDKTKKINDAVNTFTVRLTYTDIATVETYTVEKALTIGLAIQGKDGKEGQTGETGKSAYQIWLEAGNTGTEQDYLDSLKGNAAPAPKPIDIANGNIITVQDAGDLPLKTLHVTAATEQEHREGKNLYDVDAGSKTNDNGWITLSYDNSAGTEVKYVNYWTSNLNLKASTKYLVVAEIKSVSGSGHIHFSSINGNGGQLANFGANFSTLTNNSIQLAVLTSRNNMASITDGIRTFISVQAGQTGSITFRLSVLEDISITANTFKYEAYGKAPTPNYPTDIITTKGITNLLPVQLEQKTLNGITFIKNLDGTVTLNGTATAKADFVMYQEDISLEKGSYVISIQDTQTLGVTIGTRIDNLYYATGTKRKIDLTTNATFKKWYIDVESGTVLNNLVIYPMFERGSTKHEFVPYGRWLKVKTRGENHFKGELYYNWVNNAQGTHEKTNEYIKINMPTEVNKYSGIYLDTWTNARGTDYRTDIAHLIGKSVVYSFYAKADSPRKIYFQFSDYTSPKISLTTEWQRFSVKIPNFTPNSATFYCSDTLSPISYYIKDLMIQEGDTLTDYVKYKEANGMIDMNVYNEQGEIVDYREFVNIPNNTIDELTNEKFIQRNKKLVLTGNESYRRETNDEYDRYILQVPDSLIDKNRYRVISTHFTTTYVGHPIGNIFNYDKEIFMYPDTTKITSIDEWKAWLKEQYNAGTPVIIYYQLQTPIEHTIGYQPPILFNGYNNITLVDELRPYMDIEYYTYFKGDIGDTGIQGETGIGVSSIVEQYYLSTSNTELEGGSWKETQDPWTSGKYVWTRSKITWTDGSVTETNAILAEAVNSANINANTATQSASSAVNTANTASNTANAANKTAGEAKTTADSANTTASNANKTAGEAKQQAATATSTANTANQTANNALEQANTANQGLASLTTIVNKNYTDLQNQIDGAISTWFDSYTPTNENEPAATWIKNGEQNKHIGDLFYITSGDTSGRCYRYAYINNVYKWVLVEDAEVTKAIESASKAQATADGKATIFTGTTTPTGAQEGDLWMKSETDGILTYVKQTDGTFAWKEYNKYTDNTLAQEAKNAADNAQVTADTAQSTANTATSTANTAKSTADTAKSTADSAAQTANTAKDTANTASQTANTANQTANAANQTAAQAQKDVKTTINRVDVEYYLSTSATELNGGSWSTAAPDWEAGKYIWSRQKIYYVDTTKDPTESNAVCITGNKGTDGTPSYMHIKYSNDNIKFTDNNGKDIGSFMGVCTTTSSTAPTTFDSYEWSKTSDWAGKDKWRVDAYTRTIIENASIPTPEDFENETLVKTFLINDSQSTTWGYGNDFLAKIFTYVYCKDNYAFSSSYKADDGSRIELNDELVATVATCVATPITLNLKKGWNKICIYLNENTGDEYAYFAKKLSTDENVIFMTAYEEDMIKVGSQGIQGENAPTPKVSDTVEGYPLVINDAGDLPLKELKILPKTTQIKTTRGKNIVPTNFVDWESGQYSLDTGEKAEWSSRIRLKYLVEVTPGKDYYFNTFLDNHLFVVRAYDNTKTFVKSLGGINNGETRTLSSDISYIGVTIYRHVDENTITYADYKALFNDGSLKPLICLASETNKDFEAYIPNSPSPLYPSQIETVKGVTNLIDYKDLNKWVFNQNMVTIIDGGIKVSITNTNNKTWQYAGYLFPDFERNLGKTFTIQTKAKVSGTNKAAIRLYWGTDTGLLSNCIDLPSTGGTFTLPKEKPSGAKRLLILFYSNTDVTTVTLDDYSEYKDIILEERKFYYGYVPYGRWLKHTVMGKNLYNVYDIWKRNASYCTVDENDWITISRDNTEGTSIVYVDNFVYPFKSLKPNTNYYFVIEIKNVSGQGTAYFVDSNKSGTLGQFVQSFSKSISTLKNGDILTATVPTRSDLTNCTAMLRQLVAINAGSSVSITYRMSVFEEEPNLETFKYEPYKVTTGYVNLNKKSLINYNDLIKYNRDLSTVPTVGEKLPFMDSQKALQFYIPVEQYRGQYISIKLNKKYKYMRVSQVDETYNFISVFGQTSLVGNVSAQVGDTTSYLSVVICTDLDGALRENISLSSDIELKVYPGSDIDDYYELIDFSSDFKDEIINGKLIKRTDKFILDGSQKITAYNSDLPNTLRLFFQNALPYVTANSAVISDSLNNIIMWSNDNEGMYVDGGKQNIAVRLSKEIVGGNTDTIAKEYLSKNPITFYYALKTPIEYELEWQPATLFEGYNQIYLNDALYPKMESEYYTYYKGATGGKGDIGTGVASIEEEYYLSTSKDSLKDGSWTTESPKWSYGKYVWTRSKITYSNPESVEYTTPLCDSSWEAVNELEIGGRNLILNSNFAKGLNTPKYNTSARTSGWSQPSNTTLATDVTFNGHNTLHRYRTGTTSTNWTENQYYYFRDENEINNDTDYILSFWIYSKDLDWVTATNMVASAVRLRDSNGVNVGEVSLPDIRPTKAGVWQKREYKFSIAASKKCSWFYFFDSPARDFDYYLTDFKLEKGNKATDWSPAPEDTVTELANLQEQVDGKVQTYNQTTDPSTEWTTSELKNVHTGDLWYNSSTKKTQMWSGTAWTNIENAEAQAANALASKKAQVFTSTPTVPYYKGDLWVTALNKTGIVKTCTTTRTSGSYTASEWVEGLKYTDDTTANNINKKVLLLQGDSTNYSQLTDATASYWGFTADSTEDGHWYTVNTIARDKFISDFYECAGGEKMLIEFEISTSCQGNSVQTGDPVIKYLGSTIGLYSYKANKSTSAGIKYAQRITATADAAVTKVSSIVTLPNEANCFRVFLQTEGWGSYSGTIKIRNVTVKRHYAEKAYVDELVDDLQTQVDGKIQSYNQTTDPSTNWTATEKTIHTGDLWYNSSTKQTQRWSGTAWVNLENAEAQAAASLAGKKAQIFTGTPTPPYYKGDLWITSLDGKTGVVKTCKTARASGSYTASDWVESLKYTDDTTVNNMQIGGRNYISFGSGKERKGLFKKFSAIDPEDGYCTHRFVSKKTYTSITCSDAFLIKPREYVVGSQVVFSYDIMYTEWNFPSGANRTEFWFGQRYANQTITDGDKTGQWRGVTQHTLPIVGSNGCALNEWYHVEKVLTIPEQAAEGVGDIGAIQFYNSNADVEASFTLKLRNVKIELGNKATDWSPAPEDAFTEMDDLVASTETQFCIGTSATTAPAEDHPGWSTGLIVSNINTQEYLWSRIKNIKKSGEVTYSEYSCLIYAQKEMINQEIEYLLWNDNQVAPPANARYDYSYTETDENGNEHTYAGTNQWSIAKPTTNIPSHRYLWSRIHTTYKYTGATVESLAQSYTDYKLDSSWNKMFDLTGSLQANVNKILQDIQGGYVRITGGSILVGDNETNPKNLIIINHKGIAFFENPSGVWPDANTIENATSTWMIDGSLNMQDIAVTNLVASSIANQYLVLGNDNKNNADVAGDLDIYDRLGHVMFETILNSTEDYIDGFKIYKYKLNGSTMTPNGYINLSREYGFREYDAQGKMIFGNENGVFSSVANKTKQQIIADTNSSSVTYGAQMVPMRIIENEGKSNQIIHVGIAFLKL